MEVKDFEILLIDVTFCHYHVQMLVFDVPMKKKRNGNRDWRLNGSRDVSDTYKVTFPLFNCNEYLVLIIIVCLSFHPIGLLIYLMKCLRFVLISFTSK